MQQSGLYSNQRTVQTDGFSSLGEGLRFGKPPPYFSQLCWKINSLFNHESESQYQNEKLWWKMEYNDKSPLFMYEVNIKDPKPIFTGHLEGRKINIHEHLSHIIFPHEDTSYWKLEKVTFEPNVTFHKSYESRLASFTANSCPLHLKQRSKEFAYCGFFFQQLSDHVRCFACGISVHAWEWNDDIRKEHKNNKPFCT